MCMDDLRTTSVCVCVSEGIEAGILGTFDSLTIVRIIVIRLTTSVHCGYYLLLRQAENTPTSQQNWHVCGLGL